MVRAAILIFICFFVMLTGCSAKQEAQQRNLANQQSLENEEKEEKRPANDIPDSALHAEAGKQTQDMEASELGTFRKGIFFHDVNLDEKVQEIYTLFEKNVKALVSKDEAAYEDTFTDTDAAENMMFFLETAADYQFVGTPQIEDQSSETGRINVIFSYRTSDEADQIKVLTTTFTQNEDGNWKIALID